MKPVKEAIILERFRICNNNRKDLMVKKELQTENSKIETIKKLTSLQQ